MFIERGTYLLQERDKVDTIYIVISGLLEVYTEFDGNEFLLERLGPGSVINYRTIFMEEEVYVNIKAITITHLQQLTCEKLDEIR